MKMAKKDNTAVAATYDDESIAVALEGGDSDVLSASLKNGYDRRVVSINPQIQKKLAKKLLELAEYDPPEKVRTSTNSAVQRLEELRKQLKASNALTPTVEAALNAQIEEASNTFIASDGIQKGWQAFSAECIAYWFRNHKKLPKVADAIEGSISEIVEYGAKRAMSKEEKAAYEKSKTNGTTKKEEEEE